MMVPVYALSIASLCALTQPTAGNMVVEVMHNGARKPLPGAMVQIYTIRQPNEATHLLRQTPTEGDGEWAVFRDSKSILDYCLNLQRKRKASCEKLRVFVDGGTWQGYTDITPSQAGLPPSVQVEVKLCLGRASPLCPPIFATLCASVQGAPCCCPPIGCAPLCGYGLPCWCPSYYPPTPLCSGVILCNGSIRLPHSSYPAFAGAGRLVVSVPEDAIVFINGHRTSQTGPLRNYVSLDLKPGNDYEYLVRAEVVRDGKVLTETRKLTLHTGDSESLALDFAGKTDLPLAAAP